jgi:hypothetical protein
MIVRDNVSQYGNGSEADSGGGAVDSESREGFRFDRFVSHGDDEFFADWEILEEESEEESSQEAQEGERGRDGGNRPIT